MTENKATHQTLKLPLLITRGLLVFPNMSESIEVSRLYTMAAIDEARKSTNSLIFVVAQKSPDTDNVEEKDIYEYASLCRIVNYVDQANFYRVRVVGSKRVKLSNFEQTNGYWSATGEVIEDVLGAREDEEKLVKKLSSLLAATPSIARNMPKTVVAQLSKGMSSIDFVDTLGAYLPFKIEQKERLLGEPNVNKRLEICISLLEECQESEKVEYDLSEKVRKNSEKQQKEYFLREKMKAIREELGEDPNGNGGEEAIRKKIEENPYPENIKAKVKSELRRYSMMPESSLEASLILNYIETLVNTPWYQSTEDNEDLKNVQKVLDEDHFGLDKCKKRIIEYLAVKKMTGNLKAPILCFYGPPGCGKTSLGKSIARALGRKFYKCSLGGISDEAEIRGHRRTYVGSKCGRIIEGMNKTGVINPVFLLDEIDKVGRDGYKGDPTAALLEVLDPEQNFAFNDNFLEEPYDLSNVLFLCTANYIENVPAPLRDRLELIEVPSYTELEKIKIATGFLIPKQMKANGLKDGDIEFEEEAIQAMIEHYSMEAGVRQLERLVASVCRKVVVKLLEDPKTKKPVKITADEIVNLLGIWKFEGTKKEKENQVGVVTGLAYTEFGGDILPIEVTAFPGKGGLVLTGKLGDVMKESASIALDYVRTNAKKYGIEDKVFQENDIHVHVPEGAVPKDGPSAGVAITTSIISCLTGKAVNANVAMTGEVTLRGKALPIGGLREKSLAALRSGIKTIVVPEENKKDVTELPNEVKDNLKIVFMKTVDDALDVALVSSKA